MKFPQFWIFLAFIFTGLLWCVTQSHTLRSRRIPNLADKTWETWFFILQSSFYSSKYLYYGYYRCHLMLQTVTEKQMYCTNVIILKNYLRNPSDLQRERTSTREIQPWSISQEVFTQTLNESQDKKLLMPKRNLSLKAQQLLKQFI